MISTRNLLTVAVACVIGLLPWIVAAQGIDNYSAVTEARLLKPEPQNWLMYRGTYDGWGLQSSGPDQDDQRQEAGTSVDPVVGDG